MARKIIMQEFAIFLNAKRLALGMDQGELAIKIFGDKNRRDYISRIETGKKDISLRSMDAILEALDAGIEFIE